MLFPAKERLEIKKMLNKRIGIYGGAFDPLHYGHIKPIDEVFIKHDLDIIHFIPTNISNSSKVIFASHESRLKMLSIGLNNKAYIADDREIRRKGVSYTIDTIRSVMEEYDDAKIYLIIGSDALSELHKWKDSEKIISCCNIIVLSRIMKNNAPRLNKHLKSHISKDLTMFHSNSYGKIFLEETSMINISSTELRTRLQKKQEISNLMPPLLEQWLLDHKIY
mgnify:CR=1 FL=1|tara:strand:+ start:791 stop:1456 length:666 start_codon:yes stop_codon:yes gene_type:complete